MAHPGACGAKPQVSALYDDIWEPDQGPHERSGAARHGTRAACGEHREVLDLQCKS